LNVILSAAPENFLSEPEPTNGFVVLETASPDITTLTLPILELSSLKTPSPRRRILVPSSGGFATNASVPDPIKENRSCFSSGLKVILSAAPWNFLRDPDPV